MKKSYLTILLIFVIILPLSSQQLLINKTYHIVDTSKTKIEQVQEVYDWIVHNIAYDTKQLYGDNKYYSPIKTLRKRKAICYGYSELFKSMCEVLNIESYIISGYAKGFEYNKNEHFYKANHSWNIVHVDTTWLLVDATWGSGSLYYEYDFLSKLKHLVNKPGIRCKIKFSPSPNYVYFNIPPKKMIATHLPLDAKWQLKNYPLSYNTFITGKYETTGYIDYEEDISKVKYLDYHSQSFTDAVNSIKYNPYNKFDIAYQFYYQAGMVQVNKKTPLDSLLLKKLYNSVSYYDSAFYYLKGFKSISRDFYYLKKHNQKEAFRIGNNSLKQISRIPTTLNGNYEKAYKRLERKEYSLNKISANIYPEGMLIDRDIAFSYDSVEFFDSIQVEKIEEEIDNKLIRIEKYLTELNQIKEKTEIKFESGKGQDESLIDLVKAIVKYQKSLYGSFAIMNEFTALKACKDLGYVFFKYDSIMESKNSIDEKLKTYFDKLDKKYVIAERALNSLLRDYDKLAKMTGNNPYYSVKANETKDVLHKLYKLKIETVKVLKINNKSWKILLEAQNQILNSGYMNLTGRLELFYDFISNRNNKNYSNDMKIYEKINSEAKRRYSLIKRIIKEIEKSITAKDSMISENVLRQ